MFRSTTNVDLRGTTIAEHGFKNFAKLKYFFITFTIVHAHICILFQK